MTRIRIILEYQKNHITESIKKLQITKGIKLSESLSKVSKSSNQ